MARVNWTEPEITPIDRSRIVRDPAFAKRFESACDGKYPDCPPLHGGRLVWIRDEFKKRGIKISTENVRKWMWGEAKPRPEKTALLAEILGVDLAWLQIGVDPGFSPRERRVRNAMADGVVNVLAGFIQMDGGIPAFPEDGDERAQRDGVDLYAIIKGANYAIHVSLGDETDAEGATFPVPVDRDNVIVLGVLRSGFEIAVFDISSELIAANGTRRGASIAVTVTADQRASLTRIRSFSGRL